MANEGSTKPTYSELEAENLRVRGLLQRMVELLDECEDSESWRIKVGQWRASLSAPDANCYTLPNGDCIGGPCMHDAESADIGKLDRVDKSELGRFELKRDDETGRLFWCGAEDGWKEATEVGENGTLIMKSDHFPVGTVLRFMVPANSERGKE